MASWETKRARRDAAQRTHFAAVSQAANGVRLSEDLLARSVAEARAAGLSWDRIAAATFLHPDTLRRRYGGGPDGA